MIDQAATRRRGALLSVRARSARRILVVLVAILAATAHIPICAHASVSGPEGPIWVTFARNEDVLEAPSAAIEKLTVRALKRRRLRGQEPDSGGYHATDRGPNPTILAQLEATGARIRTVSRWLNAVSVEVPHRTRQRARTIARVRDLPHVVSLKPVARHRSHLQEPQEVSSGWRRSATANQDKRRHGILSPADIDSSAYGLAFEQLDHHNIPAVHDQGYTGSGVRVAVMDAGFLNLDDHSALQHLPVFARYDFVDDDPNPDPHWHGSQVVSMMAGRDSSAYIAPAPGIELMVARTEDVTDESPLEEDYFIAALEWAELNGADLAVVSLSYNDWYDPWDFDGDTSPMTIACDEAAARGLLVVTSAGNDGPAGIGVPADGDTVLAVGAVDILGNAADFSSQGPTADGRIKPDVMGRGHNVYMVDANSQDEYRIASGTSYSCPLIAGVVALLLEAEPALQPADILDILRATSSQADNPDNTMGYGVVDALAALQLAETGVRDVSQTTVSIPHRPALTVHPNPANGWITVTVASPLTTTRTLRVWSVTGRRMAERVVPVSRERNGVGFDVSGWASGIYLVGFAREPGATATRFTVIK